MRNSNHEILNPKQYQNPNVLNSKLSWGLEYLSRRIGIPKKAGEFENWDLFRI